jgi:hypothetical protein
MQAVSIRAAKSNARRHFVNDACDDTPESGCATLLRGRRDQCDHAYNQCVLNKILAGLISYETGQEALEVWHC